MSQLIGRLPFTHMHVQPNCPLHVEVQLVCPECERGRRQAKRGRVTGGKKAAAARANGAKGGRPAKRYIAYITHEPQGEVVWPLKGAPPAHLTFADAHAAANVHLSTIRRGGEFRICVIDRVTGQVYMPTRGT